jgi:hypothetical protein
MERKSVNDRTAARLIADPAALAQYKRVLQQVLDSRPSGTRQRLAELLGKNRSFISQISNPNYSVPIPARHVDRIFEVCHFSAAERNQFLEAYVRAHPRRNKPGAPDTRWREITLRVPDLHDAEKNKRLEDLLNETALRVARLIEDR